MCGIHTARGGTISFFREFRVSIGKVFIFEVILGAFFFWGGGGGGVTGMESQSTPGFFYVYISKYLQQLPASFSPSSKTCFYNISYFTYRTCLLVF